MEKVFGKAITELKFFGFDYFDYKGTKHLIARSGWSKQGGYEVYVENASLGQDLYDYLFEIGVEFNVCLLYTSPSPRDLSTSRMPSSA